MVGKELPQGRGELDVPENLFLVPPIARIIDGVRSAEENPPATDGQGENAVMTMSTTFGAMPLPQPKDVRGMAKRWEPVRPHQ